jgi:hypothetical protein
MKFTIVLIAFCFSAVLFAQDQPVFEEPSNGPKIAFTETRHEFGDIVQGAVVEHIFSFENTGNEPLILQDVKTTCGCTVPVWPREPIAPGDTSSIKVKFNSRGKVGVQNKVITIISNATNQRERVMIVTNVMLRKEEEG